MTMTMTIEPSNFPDGHGQNAKNHENWKKQTKLKWLNV
jgi:hypothetical protein